MNNVEPGRGLNVAFIDQTQDARDAAKTEAERRHAEDVNSGGRFKRAFNRFWKEGMFKEYYVLKHERQAQAEIDNAGSALALSATEQDRARAEQAIIDRFLHEDRSLVHEEAGEARDILGEDSPLVAEVKALIAANVSGRLSDEAMIEEKNRILAAFAGHSDKYEGMFGEAKAKVDNMLAVTNAVRTAVEHGESLEDVMAGLNVTLGVARNNVRTESKYNTVDKVMDKLQSSRIGSLVNPATVTTAAAIASGLIRYGSKRTTATLLAFIPPLSAGLWGAAQESKRFKDDRRSHAISMAQGGSIEQGSVRREEVEAVRYDTKSAQELVDSLSVEGALDSEDALAVALAALAEAEARNSYSNSNHVDLVTYSDVSRVGEERMMLDIAIAQAKVSVGGMSDDMRMAMAERLGIDTSSSVEGIIAQSVANYTENSIEADINSKDQLFKKIKRRRMLAAGTAAGVSSLVGGAVIQEAVAVFNPNVEGLVDSLNGESAVPIDGERHNTLINSWVSGEERSGYVGPSDVYGSYNNGLIEMSDDHSAIFNNGEMQVLNGNGDTVLSGIAVNQDGTLPQESADLLRQHGYDVSQSSVLMGHKTVTEAGDARDFLDAVGSEKVTRDFWYDNDTPKPVFDKNELGLDFGGEGRTGINANGHYEYTISGMTSDGSYHEEHSANWRSLAEEGELKVALSVSRDTQDSVIMVDIDPNTGNIVVDPNSPAGHLFEEVAVTNTDGSPRLDSAGNALFKSEFKGAFMEVVEVTGVDEEGVSHMRPLATVVGSNSIGELPVERQEPVYGYASKITSAGYEKVGDVTEVPVGPAFVVRRPLEMLAKRVREPEVAPEQSPPERRAYYYGSESISEQERQAIRDELSPRFARNPDARFHLAQEVDWYRDSLIARQGREHVSRIETQIDSSPELSHMDRKLETIITIPVAAAHESENIYKTLSLYGQQDQAALEKSMVVINLNWLDSLKGDSAAMDRVQRTADEIDRARRDFPDLKIAVVRNEYDAAKVRKTGGPIGYVARDLVDAALLALNRNIQEGNISQSQEVVILRHDADMLGMSRRHLSQFQSSARNNSTADFFKGVTRFGVRGAAERYPGYGIITSFSSAISLEGVNAGRIHSGGANFAIRASTLAAMGGLGELPRDPDTQEPWSGAGSDDTYIGRKLIVAREIDVSPQSYGSYGYGGGPADRGKLYSQPVVGANIDTNPDRLLAEHLSGNWFQEAWASFSRGSGGYKPRTTEAGIKDRIKKESSALDSPLYDMVDKSISRELRTADKDLSRRVLSIYFGAKPGLYTLTYAPDGVSNPTFRLTNEGRVWLKNRIERESNGRFGSYGARKMRQLYGDKSHKRQPVSTSSPLVSPL